MSKTTWDKTDKIALAASVAGHAVLFGLLSLQLARPKAAEMPKPIAVEILAESDLEATSPNPTDEAPAAMKADEAGPVEDALAGSSLPEPTPVMPDPEPLPVVRPDPIPVTKVQPKQVPARKPEPKATTKPTQKTVTKTAAKPKTEPRKVTPTKAQPKTAPAKKTPTKTATKVTPKKSTTKSTAKTSSSNSLAKAVNKTGAGSGKGTAKKSSGDLDGMVNAVGKTKGTSSSASGKSAAQIKQSITTSIGNQVRTPWNSCRVSGIDVDALTTTVKFRLNKDGTLGGFTSTATTGQNDSNKNQVSRHQECAKKAITQASPFTGLPPEHYSYWQNYEFKFQKR